MAPAMWEVVGGGDKGGLLVRQGIEVSSAALPDRLATGSTVEQLDLKGERLKYRLLKGKGPQEGWVSTRLPNKELLVPIAGGSAAAAEATSGLWDFDDLPESYVAPQPPAEPPVGSSWNPRWCDKPAPEAPYTRSLLDFSMEELGTIPKCIFSLRSVMKLKDWKDNVVKAKPGAHWGINFPHDFTLLREAGPAWLTKAFHRAGTLPRDNSVVSMKVHELSTDSMAAESMGGQGMKGWLQVEYEKPHPQLHTDLFVKLPFPYTPQNERVKNSFNSMPDESEILVNRLLGPALPFRIPKYYFGDISYETSNYILISEKLPYKTTSWAEGGKDMVIAPFEVEPRIVKFKDYEMPEEGFHQYAAAMEALGRMIAEYHKGGLGHPDVLRHFLPRGPESPAEAMGWGPFFESLKGCGEGGVVALLAQSFGGNLEAAAGAIQSANDNARTMAEMFGAQGLEFVRLIAPKIFPELCDKVEYLRRYWREALEVSYYTWEINMYLNMDPAFISLAHSNLAADNAWYWRDAEGKMQAGLLDFGGTAYNNIASCLTMSWTMAEPSMLKDHWQDLLHSFVNGVRERDGPESITYEEMLVCASLAFAKSSPLCGGNVQQLLKIMKKDEWGKVKDRWQPECNDRFLPRNYTCALRTVLLIWEYMDLYGRFKEWREKNKHWFPPKKPFECPPLPICLQ